MPERSAQLDAKLPHHVTCGKPEVLQRAAGANGRYETRHVLRSIRQTMQNDLMHVLHALQTASNSSSCVNLGSGKPWPAEDCLQYPRTQNVKVTALHSLNKPNWGSAGCNTTCKLRGTLAQKYALLESNVLKAGVFTKCSA